MYHQQQGEIFSGNCQKNSFVALKTTTHHQSSQFGQKLNLAHCGRSTKTLKYEIENEIVQFLIFIKDETSWRKSSVYLFCFNTVNAEVLYILESFVNSIDANLAIDTMRK